MLKSMLSEGRQAKRQHGDGRSLLISKPPSLPMHPTKEQPEEHNMLVDRMGKKKHQVRNSTRGHVWCPACIGNTADMATK